MTTEESKETKEALHTSSLHGVAFNRLQEAADKQDPLAQLTLATCYARGEEITQDEQQAVAFYQLAADQKNAFAQFNLGVCYTHGKGVVKNEIEAAKWYQLAADQGHVLAQLTLAMCYVHGKGVSKNINQTAFWHEQLLAQLNLFKNASNENHQGIINDILNKMGLYLEASNNNNVLSVQERHELIFFVLSQCYEKSLELLKLQLKEEVASIVTKKLKENFHSVEQLSLKNVVVSVYGANIIIGNAVLQGIVLPPILKLAHHLNLGKFIFTGDRSERKGGHVNRHSNHNLGVSALFPSAHYKFDVYFKLNNDREKILIATGEKYVSGSEDNTNPGNRRLAHVADANFNRVSAILKEKLGKPLDIFFQEMWTDDKELVFSPAPKTIGETEKEENREEYVFVETYILKENIENILSLDAIKNFFIALDFYYTLADGYAKNVHGNFLEKLSKLKNSKDINDLFLSYFTDEETEFLFITLDNVFEKIMEASRPDSLYEFLLSYKNIGLEDRFEARDNKNLESTESSLMELEQLKQIATTTTPSQNNSAFFRTQTHHSTSPSETKYEI